MKALRKTKKFEDFDFNGRWILTGSDSVDLDDIEAFVARRAIVQPNWGMSEVGPIAINIIIDHMDLVQELKKLTPPNYAILGNTFYVDYKIISNELHIKSDLCIYDDWFATGDLVSQQENFLFYKGRVNDS